MTVNNTALLLFLYLGILSLSGTLPAQSTGDVHAFLTNKDRTELLAEQHIPFTSQPAPAEATTIRIDPAKTYQTLDGFGFALTSGSAQLLHRMDPAPRHDLLEQLFGNHPGQMAVSYLRISIGASDMNDHVYTYDDMPPGQTDPNLQHFTLAEDEKDVIPILKEVLAIAPHLQILASPWTAPSWMKTNDLPKAGQLRPESYPVYANYFVRYLQAMRAEGIPIAAITLQNEPLNPKNTPSMHMEAPEEAAFLRDALGPALAKARLNPHIILFDHNCNHPDYPITILQDPKAAQYADGSGFHLYEGDIAAMSEVHNAFPTKNLYFTEQMIVEHTHDGALEPVAYPVSRVLIGAVRNWSRNVLLWNLAADPSFGPHTNEGGCPVCQGAITLDGNKVERNIALYTIAHASEFVPPNSVRIDSTQTDLQLANAAFKTPGGKYVLLVTNTSPDKRTFTVQLPGKQFTTELDAGSVATYVW